MASDTPADKGPKKIDTNQYKELQAKQTAKAQEQISSQATTSASASFAPSTRPEDSSGAGGTSNSTIQPRD